MTTVYLIILIVSIALAWQCWRDLDAIRLELQRHKRGRAIKRRVLAEAAKLKAVRR